MMSNKYKIQCATQYYPLYRYSLFKKMGVKKMKCKNSEYFMEFRLTYKIYNKNNYSTCEVDLSSL